MFKRAPAIRSLARLSLLCTWILLSLPAVAQDTEAVPVSVARVQMAQVNEPRRLSGTLNALRRSNLSPRTSGVVSRIVVDAGALVRSGDVLLEIDAALIEREVAQAHAAVEEAQVRLRESQRLSEEAKVLAAQRNLARSQADARAAEVLVATAALARIRADASLIRERQQRHTLRAPYDGVIARRMVDIGEWLEPSAPAFELVALDALVFDVRMPQEWLSEAQVGTPVQVRLDALPAQALQGSVLARVPAVETDSRSLLLRIGFETLPEGLLPGLSGRAEFAAGSAAVALLVPRDALLTRPDGGRAVVVVDDSSGQPLARIRVVQVGDALGPQVQVTGSLQLDERVVVRGNERLSEGQLLRLVE